MDNRRPVVLFPPAGMVVPANPALDAAYLLAVRTTVSSHETRIVH